MADELSKAPASNEAETDNVSKTPVVKKTRAPRSAKTAAAVVTSSPVAEPKGRRGGRRKTVAVEPVAASSEAKAKGKGRGRAKAPSAPKASKTVVTFSQSDELADLLQLEEENRQLRKTLAEKLRAENADLRKRIGS